MTTTIERGISLAIPNKGRLSDSAVQLLERAGISVNGNGPANRQLFAMTWKGRVKILYVRAQDVPELVQDGVADLGITGLDLVVEAGKRVQVKTDLKFGHCRLVVAVPQKKGVSSLADLPRRFTVATSFPRTTRRFFKRQGKDVRIVPISGAAEIMPHIGVADAIVDLTATGSTLAMNDLVEIASIQESTAHLIASPKAARDPAKRELMEDVRFAIASVVNARGKRYLMADVPTARLKDIRKLLPGIAGPTVMDIYGQKGMKAVHVVVDEDEVYDAMRRLKRLGAQGILVVPVDRMVA